MRKMQQLGLIKLGMFGIALHSTEAVALTCLWLPIAQCTICCPYPHLYLKESVPQCVRTLQTQSMTRSADT